MQAEHKEKYLKLFDIMELQLLNYEKKKTTAESVVSLLIALIDMTDLKDIERVVALFMELDKVDLVLTSIYNLATENKFENLKEELIILSYLEALSRGWLHICMQVMIIYPDILIYNDDRVLGPLIDSLKSSSFQMDTKLAMIKQFLPKIKFQHIDMLVNNF